MPHTFSQYEGEESPLLWSTPTLSSDGDASALRAHSVVEPLKVDKRGCAPPLPPDDANVLRKRGLVSVVRSQSEQSVRGKIIGG